MTSDGKSDKEEQQSCTLESLQSLLKNITKENNKELIIKILQNNPLLLLDDPMKNIFNENIWNFTDHLLWLMKTCCSSEYILYQLPIKKILTCLRFSPLLLSQFKVLLISLMTFTKPELLEQNIRLLHIIQYNNNNTHRNNNNNFEYDIFETVLYPLAMNLFKNTMDKWITFIYNIIDCRQFIFYCIEKNDNLRQEFINLLSNNSKYYDIGSVKLLQFITICEALIKSHHYDNFNILLSTQGQY